MYHNFPIRVLYIEDDRITAARVQQRLDQHGYQVDVAMDGQEGLAKLQQGVYDLVAVDYHLPGMNGLQVLKNLNKTMYKGPTIMLTGAGDEHVAVEAMKLGAGDYLIKDIDSQYLNRLPKVIEYEIEKQRIITERVRAEYALHYRDTILEAVSFAAEKFLTASTWTQPIQEVLAHFGKAISASRIYISENHPDLPISRRRYEWVAQNMHPQKNNTTRQKFSYTPLFLRWYKKLKQGQPIYGLTKDFPKHEVQMLSRHGVLSIAAIPIFVQKKWWGFIGYEDCSTEREWSPVVIEVFRVAASILGAAIQQEQMNQALRESEARLAKTQQIAHLGHCDWDIASNKRFLSNESLKILGLPTHSHYIDNDLFIKAIHPEDRKRVQRAVKKLINKNTPYNIEFRIIRPDGTIRCLHALAELIHDPQGKPIRFLSTLQDMTSWKQAEKALYDSQARLKAIFDNAAVAIGLVNTQGCFIQVNAKMAQMVGYSIDELLRMDYSDISFFEDIQAEFELFKRLVSGTISFFRRERRYRRKNGDIFWGDLSVTPIHNQEGRFQAALGIVTEISERKQAEQALCKERDFINAVLNTAGSLVVVLDRWGHIVRFNRSCEELSGYCFEEVKGAYVWDFFIQPNDIEPIKNYFENLIMAHHPLRYENYWLTQNQQHRFISWSNTVLLNEQGQVEYVVATGIDITERKQAENALARTLAEQNVILEHALVGIAFLGEKRQIIRVNRKLEAMFGYSEQELKGMTTETLYPSEQDYETIGQATYPLIKQGKTYKTEHLMRHKDGHLFWCRFLIKAINSSDLSQGYIWNLEDVTEQRRTENSLRLAATVFETITEGIIVTDANHQIIVVNPAFTTITGYTLQEVIGQSPALLNYEQQQTEFYEKIWDHLLTVGQWQGELQHQRKQGEIYTAWTSMVAIWDSNQQLVHHVIVLTDITERKRAEELIWHQAHYDALTNLPNRIFFTQRLGQLVEEAKNQKIQLALVFIDLDHFKWVNDNLGHDVGDQLLQEVATRLVHCVRQSDIVSRLGGDEFTIILNKIKHISEPRQIIENILEQLSSPFILNNQTVFVSGSLGITLFPKDGQAAEILLKNADMAMYQAKNKGRNTFCFFRK